MEAKAKAEPSTHTEEKPSENQQEEKKLQVPKKDLEVVSSLQTPDTEKLVPPEAIESVHKRKSIKVQQAINLSPEAIELNRIIGNSRRQSVMMYQKEQTNEAKEAPATLDQFEILRLIGRGAFGKVFLTEFLKNGKLYAMKCIRKELIVEHDQMQNLTMERDILKAADHPFLINLDYIFQDEQRIYFIMPFIKGGSLFTHHLKQEGNFSEMQVKFFIV